MPSLSLVLEALIYCDCFRNQMEMYCLPQAACCLDRRSKLSQPTNIEWLELAIKAGQKEKQNAMNTITSKQTNTEQNKLYV